MVGVRPIPPPQHREKPSSPASFLTSYGPMSYQAKAARSSRAPLIAILNLQGRKANSGCSVLHWRRIPRRTGAGRRFVGRNAGQRVAIDIADAVAAGLDAVQLHGGQQVHHVGGLGHGIQLYCTLVRVVKWP